MMLGFLLMGLAILAAIVIAAPFLKHRSADEPSATGVEVYKDQLDEIERDLEQGTIGKEEANLARVEIERRLLNAARTEDRTDSSLNPGWHYRMVTGVAAIVVLGSVGIYATISHADRFFAQQARNAAPQPVAAQPAQQAAQQGQNQTPQAGANQQLSADVEALVTRLQQRLAENPEDADGWRVLGWSYYNTGDYEKSVEAYRRAAELQKDNALVRSLLGEAMVRAADGRVTDDALDTFQQVVLLSPNDERARFFMGLAQEQKGNPQGAIDEWVSLYQVAPKDAEWSGDLRNRIESLAQAHNIDVSGLLDASAERESAEAQPEQSQQRGPTAEDIENAQQMSAGDRTAMVRGMVDGLATRLESAPDDPQGWIMLMRSHIALNEREKAQAALDRATEALSGSPEKLKQIADAARVMGLAVQSK